jgi:hypothetical protein
MLAENELLENSVIKDFLITATDAKKNIKPNVRIG